MKGDVLSANRQPEVNDGEMRRWRRIAEKKERMSALTRRTVSFETSLTEMFSHYFSHLTI